MLTHGFTYYMLHSGMSHQFNIRPGFFQKALSIMLTVLLGIGFSFGGALASSCERGADCPVCAELPHGHVSKAPSNMQGPGCTPDRQTGSCGFESGQDPDKLQSIVSPARSNRESHAGIFTAASDEFDHLLLPKNLIPRIALSKSGKTNPIYLLNQSLLC